MANCEELKQQLIASTIRKHNVLIQQLDIQYSEFIGRLFQQKQQIINRMQQQLEQHIQHIHNLKLQHNYNQNNPSSDSAPYLSLLSLLLNNSTHLSLKTDQHQHQPPKNSNMDKTLQMSLLTDATTPLFPIHIETAEASTKTAETSFSFSIQSNADDNHEKWKHEPLKPFGCQYCSKRFVKETDLNTHEQYKCLCVPYTGKKRSNQMPSKYICNDCGKAFLHRSNLKIHSIIHTDNAFSCSHCGKKFARKTNLTQHLRVHTGERPYSCPICGKSFKQSHSVKDHIKTHKEKPYECDGCKQQFKHANELTRHIRLKCCN